MKRIAVMITDMFQDVEYECPEIFIRAGHEFVNVGTTEGALVKGEQGMIVKITAPQRMSQPMNSMPSLSSGAVPR